MGPNRGGNPGNYPQKKCVFLGLVRSYSWFVNSTKTSQMSLRGGVPFTIILLKVHTSINRQGYLEEYTTSDLNKKAALKDLM